LKLTKLHIGNRVLWLFMALHILNFSIDTPHTLRDTDTVDRDFEEVDSMVELVLEKVLDIEDAIPENHTKSPVSNKFNMKKMAWTFYEQPDFTFEPVADTNFRIILSNTFYRDSFYHSPFLALFSPPPEA